jgi:hypothetical protein
MVLDGGDRLRARAHHFAYAIAIWIAFLQPHAAYASDAKAKPAGRSAVAVGPQYDTTHVYVAPGDLDAFVNSFVATFGGSPSKRTVASVTPVPGSTEMQAVLTPVGVLSIFAYQTPAPFPFGEERTGYLVADMDQAIKAARSAGAEVIVEPFKDPIGMDAVIQWPGGVKMQLYWHFKPSTNPPLDTIPDNRVYVSLIRPTTSCASPKGKWSWMTSTPTQAKSGVRERPTAAS